MKILKIVVGMVIFASFYMQAKLINFMDGTHARGMQEKLIDFMDGTHARGIFGDKISLRFNSELIVNYLPSAQDYIEAEDEGIDIIQFKEITFFMPLVTIKSDKVRRFVKQINSIEGKPYYVALEQTTGPMKGLKCTIGFNPQEVGFRVELFVSPKQEHGVSLMFFNRNQLTTIATQHDTIKRVACIKGDSPKKKYV